MENNEPGAWITPAMLDKIEDDGPLCLLSHADCWINWPQRWKAMRKLVDEHFGEFAALNFNLILKEPNDED